MSGGVAGAAGQLLGGGGTALAGVFSSSSKVSLMRLTGPGRVGMQSMYQHRTNGLSAMTTATDTYTCPYCRQPSDGGRQLPELRGAGRRRACAPPPAAGPSCPAIADMTRIQAGHSSVQIEGSVAPVADWNLAAGETVYFPHHKLLWQEPSVQLSAMPMCKPWTRMRAGLPLVMAQATGPGHIAFSHDAAGEIIAVPLQAGAAVDVCEHRLLVATQGVGYDWYEAGVWYSTSGRRSGGDRAPASVC